LKVFFVAIGLQGAVGCSRPAPSLPQVAQSGIGMTGDKAIVPTLVRIDPAPTSVCVDPPQETTFDGSSCQRQERVDLSIRGGDSILVEPDRSVGAARLLVPDQTKHFSILVVDAAGKEVSLSTAFVVNDGVEEHLESIETKKR
jgi:hypothetical protein